MEFMNLSGGNMRNIVSMEIKNQEDCLKYAYAFMQSKQLYIKECAFVNPKPNQFDGVHMMPQDLYSATYTDTLPSWDDFKKNKTHISSAAISCVGSVDTHDKKRVVLMSVPFMNAILFNCYGNYEDEAKKAFEEIKTIYSTLK